MKIRNVGILTFVIVMFFACNNQSNENNSSGLTVAEETQNIFHQLAGETAAIAYSGFRTGQHPDRGDGAKNPTYKQTVEDLQILSDAGFRLIRLYDSGENSEMVLRVIQDNHLDMKVLLGIWLKAELSNHEGCSWLHEPIPQSVLEENKIQNRKEIERGIALAEKYENIVVAVNVGNEALVDWNDHMVPVDTVIVYVEQVKSAIDQEVSVADNYKWWANHGRELAGIVDFISIHIYPVWEEKNIEESLSYSIENIREVQDSLPEAKILITEAGWPSIASEFSEIASEENQQRYLEEMLAWSEENKITMFIFEAFDEDWKGNPENPLGAEKHWGIFNIDRSPKLVMQSKLNHK